MYFGIRRWIFRIKIHVVVAQSAGFRPRARETNAFGSSEGTLSGARRPKADGRRQSTGCFLLGVEEDPARACRPPAKKDRASVLSFRRA